MYAPRRILCVPDNAWSLAMISIEIVVRSSESEKLSSCVMIMSENVDVDEELILTVLLAELDALVILSAI